MINYQPINHPLSARGCTGHGRFSPVALRRPTGAAERQSQWVSWLVVIGWLRQLRMDGS